jgi:DNA-binding transcriptional LysR family regulator
MVARLAATGLGVAVLPASTANGPATALRILKITGPPVRSRLELAWHPEPSARPAARVLAEHARVFAARLDPKPPRPEPAQKAEPAPAS